MTEKPYYGLFSGPIDHSTLHRLFGNFAAASLEGFTELHVLYQSPGGNIGDGVALYNFLRGFPLPVSFYNVGLVGSVAAVAFLGAQHRFVAEQATFLIHKSTVTPEKVSLQAAGLYALGQSLAATDERVEAITKAHTRIPEAKWAAHAVGDVVLDAAESVEFGLAQAVREWQVPAGQRIFNI